MPNELSPWKQEGCAFLVKVARLSDREVYSREINEARGEGGGLNADYRTVEAVAIAANTLGKAGLIYGKHFVFKTAENGQISFDALNIDIMSRAVRVLHFLHPPR